MRRPVARRPAVRTPAALTPVALTPVVPTPVGTGPTTGWSTPHAPPVRMVRPARRRRGGRAGGTDRPAGCRSAGRPSARGARTHDRSVAIRRAAGRSRRHATPWPGSEADHPCRAVPSADRAAVRKPRRGRPAGGRGRHRRPTDGRRAAAVAGAHARATPPSEDVGRPRALRAAPVRPPAARPGSRAVGADEAHGVAGGQVAVAARGVQQAVRPTVGWPARSARTSAAERACPRGDRDGAGPGAGASTPRSVRAPTMAHPTCPSGRTRPSRCLAPIAAVGVRMARVERLTRPGARRASLDHRVSPHRRSVAGRRHQRRGLAVRCGTGREGGYPAGSILATGHPRSRSPMEEKRDCVQLARIIGRRQVTGRNRR